jgi:hypothetical protein
MDPSEPEARAGFGSVLHDNEIIGNRFSAFATSGWSACDRWSKSTMDDIW